MTYSRLLACFAAAGLLAACSDQTETSVADVADEASQSAAAPAIDSGSSDGGRFVRVGLSCCAYGVGIFLVRLTHRQRPQTAAQAAAPPESAPAESVHAE